MKNNAHVFKIMIASPSDAREQRLEIRDIIYHLNTYYADQNIFFFPYMWEKDVPAGFYADDVQETIDEVITKNSDMIIGIFKGTIGRPRENKGNSEYASLVSYTVGEIIDHVQSGKPGVIIFIDPTDGKSSKEDRERVQLLRAHLDEVIGINVIDLKFDSEIDFSKNISDKLRQSIDEMIKREKNKGTKFRDNIPNQLTYFDNLTASAPISLKENYNSFQTIPYFAGGVLRDEIQDVVNYSFKKLREFYSEAEGYWTKPNDDNDFNRVYFTSSVLTYLFQLGIDQDSELVKRPLDYIRKKSDPTDINLRAGNFFLLAFHRLSQYNARRFIQTLIKFDKKKRGEIILSQEDSSKKGNVYNWRPRPHVDGHSFHACHISDYLLHMDSSFSEARAVAEPLLLNLRHYLVEEYNCNDGFLTNLEGDPSSITLYGYAISPALGIELPDNWLENVKKCKKIIEEECANKEDPSKPGNAFKKCLGVMNLSYMTRMSDNPELKAIANDYIKMELEYLWDNRDEICTDANNTAHWARAFVYGHDSLSTSASYYYKKSSKTGEF